MRGYVVLVPLLLIPAPASAQIWDGGADATGTELRSATIRPRTGNSVILDSIRDGRESGQLTRSDSRLLRRQAKQIENLEERYARDGLTEAEAAELAARRQLLTEDVSAKRSGTRK